MMLEVLFSDAYYDSEREDENYALVLRGLLSEFDEGARISPTDLGHGADFPGFLVQLFQDTDWPTLAMAGATGLFLLGERIERNVEAWLKVASRFREFVSKLKPIRIDEYGAALLVLDELRETKRLGASIRIAIQIVVGQPGRMQRFRLEKRPDAVYVVTVETERFVYIVGVKSTGERVFEYELGTSWIEF